MSLSVGVAWALADAWALMAMGTVDPGAAVVAKLLLLGVTLGAGVWGLGFLCWGAGRLLAAAFPRRGAWLVGLPCALVAAAGVAVAVAGLFSGPGISSRWWADLAAVALQALGVLGLAGAAALVVAAFRVLPRRRRPAVLLVLPALSVLPLLAWADRTMFPRRYEELHLVLLGGFVVAAALVGLALALWVRALRARAVNAAALGLVAACLVLAAAGEVPGEDVRSRRVLRSGAPLTSKLLKRTLPVGQGDAAASEAIWDAVLRTPGVDREELDRRFPGRRRWNLLWITVDTLRADRTGRPGRSLMPHLDDLAAGSIVFRNAYTQYPSSVLAMASTFSGLYPSATSVDRLRHEPLPDPEAVTEPVLPQRFQGAGFRTHAVTAFAGVVFDRLFFYLPRGFEVFERSPHQDWARGDVVAARAVEVLEDLGPRPWLLWVHIFDPHSPYSRHPDVPAGAGRPELYDGEVRFADRQLGRVLEAARRRPDWERTLVLVNSDHGEALGDHGTWNHNSNLYEEQVRVPLLLRLPGCRGHQVERVVELVDLAPTLTDLYDLEPLPGCHGRSLVPHLLETDPDPEDLQAPLAFAQLRETNHVRGRLEALRLGSLKLIHDADAGVHELYDLAADPGERHDLILERPQEAARVKRYLAACSSLAHGGGPQGGLDAESLRVRRLTRRVRKRAGAQRFEAVQELLALGRRREAAAALAGVVEAAPETPDRLRALRILRLLGRDAGVELLRPLVQSEDPRLRAAAALGLGRLDDPRIPGLLTHLARDPEGSVSDAAAVAFGLRGDDRGAGRLAGLATGPPRNHRDEALVALARLEGGAWRRRLQELLAWSLVPPETVVDVLRMLVEEPREAHLPLLYTGLPLSPKLPASVKLLRWKAVFAHGPGALPLVRETLADPNPAVRSHAEAWLERRGLARRRAVLERAWMRRVAARERLLDGAGPAETARALVDAYREAAAEGCHDWGLLLDAWGPLLAARGGPGTAAVLSGLRLPAGGLAAELVSRLAAVAETASSPPRPHLRLLRADPRTLPGRSTWMLAFELELDPEGGSLPGSAGSGLWLRGDSTNPLPHLDLAVNGIPGLGSRTFLRLPLPPRGLLPGEQREVLLTLPVPERLSAGHYELELGLNAGGAALGPRLQAAFEHHPDG